MPAIEYRPTPLIGIQERCMSLSRIAAVACVVSCLSSAARANFVANGSFQTGSTLPFALAVDPGATAGPVAPDGGLTVVPHLFDQIKGPGTLNSAVFEAGGRPRALRPRRSAARSPRP